MPVTRRSILEKKSMELQSAKQVSGELLSMDHNSVTCSGLRLGVKGSSASSKKAKAALQLAELKQKQIELDNELRLAAVKNEVDMARLQVTLAEDTDEEDQQSIVAEEDNSQGLERYLEDCRAHARNNRIETGNVMPVKEHLNRLDLPKVELNFFDGDAASYWMFIRQFELCIEARVNDPGQRLLYLMHYCKGNAKEAIKGCIMLAPDRGYNRAREILRERFGQPHKIARSLIDGVLDGIKVALNTTESLDELATRMQNCEIALTQMNYLADLNSLATIERIVRKLPLSLQENWALKVDSVMQIGSEPSFSDLTAFVIEKARVAGSRFGLILRESEQRQTRYLRQNISKFNEKATHASSGSYLINKEVQQVESCVACDKSHRLEDCIEFAKMEVETRWGLLKKAGRCFKCMGNMHNASGCRKRENCGKDGCRGRHHIMLHVDNKSAFSERSKLSNCTATIRSSSVVQLGTIPIRVKGPQGEFETLAFLDNGSDTTLIRLDMLKRLGIDSEPSQLTINTVTNSSSLSSQRCKLELVSADGNTTIHVDEAYAVNTLPIRMNTWNQKEIVSRWSHLKGIQFADCTNREVTVLIGCDVPEAHWVIEQRIGGRRQPYATKTPLGWLLHGPTNTSQKGVSVNYANYEGDSVRLDWQRLYDQEFCDVNDYQKCLSLEEERALKVVTDGTKLVDGRFEVPLPWRSDKPTLPENHFMATKRLYLLRNRLLKDDKLRAEYRELMESHLKKGYAVRVSEDENQEETQPCWYIPHHPVLNPKKPGKVRMVFDCAAKWNGVSLNDFLYAGPDTTSNLCGILMRFRLNLVAVAADIEEMFLRVKVPGQDQGALKFLWWADGQLNNDPVIYKLTVHPFGATSSPFCANFALRKAVETLDTKDGLNLGDIASTCFYVDDFLTSFEDVQTAVEFSQELTKKLQEGGFKLRKWLSNREDVLESVTSPDHVGKLLSIPDAKTSCHRTLGIMWNTELDHLCFEFNLSVANGTRRSILSCVSTLFDPLGLVAPLLLPAKILLQGLCKRGLDWDEQIPHEDERDWIMWTESMKRVGTISFERCMKHNCGKRIRGTQLHIFCDASEKGYGTVAYARFETEAGINCSLICGKARVAPLKAVTIPRLELTAAVLGIRMFNSITTSLPTEFSEAYFWTDSMIVLYYIRNVRSRFNTFVANRLSIIHEFSKPNQWNYVGTDENPADLASRGCYAGDESLKLWLNGPQFLWLTIEEWPTQPNGLESPKGVELKVNKICAVVSKIESCIPLLTHFSDWFKLLKATAWILRYKNYLLVMSGVRKDKGISLGPLRVEELNRARESIFLLVQRESMGMELGLLEKMGRGDTDASKQLVKQSPLKGLCPLLRDGLICVGGRLSYSNWDADTKHPIILPSVHPVTDALVRYYHNTEGHCGTSHLLATLRRKYWIMRGRSVVKKIVNKCFECKKRITTTSQQMMAPLPAVRVQPGWRAFNSVGIDYFGPMLVKRGRSMEKRYGCLFTCMQMRAIHIEVAHNLSTDSFLMALMRFIGRRGSPSEIYSDNGAAFIGAETELKKEITNLSQERINDRLLKVGIQWHFNPPLASHRGGVWERMIRSVRRLLSSISKEQTLTDEMLSTFLVEAERILNGRPIVPLNDDPADDSVLTPNDLLLLHSNHEPLSRDNQQHHYIKYWKRVNYLATLFWTRWTKEYLPMLQTRKKWLNKHRNFKPGDVVLILTEPRQWGNWPLGVVNKCEHDADGLVRTVTVKTADRELKRDVRKLALLEGDD